jgi:hypothetical protein
MSEEIFEFRGPSLILLLHPSFFINHSSITLLHSSSFLVFNDKYYYHLPAISFELMLPFNYISRQRYSQTNCRKWSRHLTRQIKLLVTSGVVFGLVVEFVTRILNL